MQIVMRDGFGLLMVDSDTMTNGVEVIICTTAGLTAFDKTLDQQLLIYHEVDHDGIHVVFLQ